MQPLEVKYALQSISRLIRKWQKKPFPRSVSRSVLAHTCWDQFAALLLLVTCRDRPRREVDEEGEE